MVKEFSKFSPDDKLFELANKRGVLYKGKTKWDLSERTWHRKDKSITIRAYRDEYTMNELFTLMGYEGDNIHRRGEYNKIPYEMDEHHNKILKPSGKITRSSYGKLRTVYWTTYSNGNIKLTGDVDEFNALYTKVWEKNIERYGNNIKYILVD